MQTITETQLQILERLHQYRFLTVDQLHRIGAADHIQTIHKGIRMLRNGKKKLIESIDFGTFPTIGRLPKIHYITHHGAKLLAEALRTDPQEITHPKGVNVFTRDYFHRLETIDLHILARMFCESHGAELDFFQAYFEHTGTNHWGDPAKPKRQAVNKIELDEKTALIPDCIFRITDPKGSPFLFVGEIYRNQTTKRLQHQLYKYLLALQKGSINKVYNFYKAFPILIICETENAMKAAQERLKNDEAFKHTEDYFLFRTYESTTGQGMTRQELQNAFALNWQTYRGKRRGLFR